MGMDRTACFLVAALVLAVAACAHRSLPSEVERFVERRDTCDHFRGEVAEPGDIARMNEVNEMLAKYCSGTDAELAALRSRYYANGAVTEKLSVYETKIEAKKR
jgi:hypothetical protein